MEDVSDVDEAVLAMWAQDEVPGAVKPVSSLYLGTVCNCGEKLECEFFLKIIFVQEVRRSGGRGGADRRTIRPLR